MKELNDEHVRNLVLQAEMYQVKRVVKRVWITGEDECEGK